MSENPNRYTPEQNLAALKLELALLIARVCRRPGGLALLLTMRDQLQRFANNRSGLKKCQKR